MCCQVLNNTNLDESVLSSELYNSLPNIDDMNLAAEENSTARASLLTLIDVHGVADKFSVHLIHKHFEIPSGRFVVYETVRGKTYPDFVLCRPRAPSYFEPGRLRGLYFKARRSSTMAAYEYTTDVGPDLSAYDGFVAQFARECVDLGVQDIFALGVKQPTAKLLEEFEFSAAKATILVPNGIWMPGMSNPETSETATDWSTRAGLDHGKDGIITLKCRKTRQSHQNIPPPTQTCRKTRNSHHPKKKTTEGNLEVEEMPFVVNDEEVPVDTVIFAIMKKALEVIEA